MKVRITGNSLRFRLKQSEVSRFKEEGEIKEVTTFGSDATDKLSFILKVTSSVNFNLNFQANTITVEVPKPVCAEWTGTEQVGFEEMIDTGKGEAIKVLVEKDFKCLDRSDIEDEDAFPNPNLHC